MKLIQMNIQEGRSPNQPQDSDFSSQRQGAKSLVLNKGQVLAENFANIEEIFNVYLGTLTSNKRILKLFGFLKGCCKNIGKQICFQRHLGFLHALYQILIKALIRISEQKKYFWTQELGNIQRFKKCLTILSQSKGLNTCV